MCAENHQTSGTKIWSWLFCTVTLLAWNTKPLPLCFQTMNTQWVIEWSFLIKYGCLHAAWLFETESVSCFWFVLRFLLLVLTFRAQSCLVIPKGMGKDLNKEHFAAIGGLKLLKERKVQYWSQWQTVQERIRMKSHVLRFSKRDLHRLSSPASSPPPPPPPPPPPQRWNCKICIHDIMKDSSGTYYIMVPMEASRDLQTHKQPVVSHRGWDGNQFSKI